MTEETRQSAPVPGQAASSTPAVLTGLKRHRERASDDRATLDAILDDALVATLATVVDGEPWVVPVLFARDGDRVLVHGSTGAGALRHVADGAPVALCVTHLDGIVVAHSTFDSSANYRSAVIRGRLEPLAGEDARRALDLLSDHVLPGRVAEVRPSSAKERAATLAMALSITSDNWITKCRNGFGGVPQAETEAWQGVVPIRVTFGEPITAPHSPPGVDVPASVRSLVASDA